MAITFLPLAASEDSATGAHRRRVESYGFTAPGVFGTHRRRQRSHGVSYSGGIVAPPEIPVLGTHQRNIWFDGVEMHGRYDEGSHDRRLCTLGYHGAGGANAMAGGEHRRRLSHLGTPEDAMSGYAFLSAMPFDVSGYGDQWFFLVRDRLDVQADTGPTPIPRIRERANLRTPARPTFSGTLGIEDELELSDSSVWQVFALVEELALFDGDGLPNFTAVGRALERLVLAGTARNVPEAIAMLLDGLVLRALAEAYHHGAVAETLLASAFIDSLYHAFAQALDRVLLTGSADGVYSLTVLVDERMVLGADLTHEADIVALIRDAVGFAMSLSLDDGQYLAWVMNTDSKGLTRYTHYPFNSFGRIGGRYLGCASDGLHWLDADDDNGEDISARIRLGMDALGVRRAKRIPEAFVGYTSDGTLLLRVIQTNEKAGRREEAIYRLPVRSAESIRENRFKVGKGLKAVDFDFVIENVAGADFDLSSIEFRPIHLDRRTRG